MVELLTLFVPVAGIISVVVSAYLARDVLSRDRGTP